MKTENECLIDELNEIYLKIKSLNYNLNNIYNKNISKLLGILYGFIITLILVVIYIYLSKIF